MGCEHAACNPMVGELRAMSGYTTLCENLAVGEVSSSHNRASFHSFQMWCQRAALPAPCPGTQPQISLIDYLDAVLEDGGSRSTAEYAVAAVRSIFPIYSGKAGVPMPRVDRALRGFRRVTPARSRFPMPLTVTAAVAVSFMALGDWEGGAQILLTHYCYLRPCEVRALRNCDLLAPIPGENPGLAFWTLLIAPSERGERTKTQTTDDTLLLDHPPWLGEVLSRFRGAKAANDFLFSNSQKQLLPRWRHVLDALGVQGACLYQLRHGLRRPPRKAAPAPGDHGARTMVLDRLVLRYAKAGKVQKIYNDFKKNEQLFVNWCNENLELIVKGVIEPRLPPNLGGSLLAAKRATLKSPRKVAKVCRRPAASASSTRYEAATGLGASWRSSAARAALAAPTRTAA